MLRRKTHEDVESPDAFEDLTSRFTPDRRTNHFLHVGDVNAVTSNGLTVDSNQQLRSAADLIHLHIGCSLDLIDHRRYLLRLPFQELQIISE